MARIRTLKPEILEDERVAALPDSAFRLFVACIVLADDHGNLRADERWLDGQVWWAHADSRKSAASLRELCDSDLVLVYSVRQQTYLHLRGWEKHQRIDNAGKPRVPGPNDEGVQVVTIETSSPDVDSPRNSASRRKTPLDHDPDHDPDHERDPDLCATSAKSPKRRHSLPVDWKPERSTANLEAEEKARARGVDLGLELAKLRDWAQANNTKKADWDSTWRNWTRNAKPLSRSHQQQSLMSGVEYARRVAEELEP